MDSRHQIAATALEKWMNLTSSRDARDRRISFEDLTLFKTGPSMDESVDISHDCTVLVKLKAGTWNSPPVWTCKAHLEDVPSDGDCGFHALLFPSRSCIGATALGTRMLPWAAETRTLLIQFFSKEALRYRSQFCCRYGWRKSCNLSMERSAKESNQACWWRSHIYLSLLKHQSNCSHPCSQNIFTIQLSAAKIRTLKLNKSSSLCN